MGLREDIRGWIDADGLVSPTPCTPDCHNASGNGLLYTGEYYLTLYREGGASYEDCRALLDTSALCEVKPGLFKRNPGGSFGQISIDDYVGLAAASAALAPVIAQQILIYGRVNSVNKYGIPFHYVYNNLNPGTWSLAAWLGRFPQLIAHIQFAAGERPALWRRAYWILCVLYACFAKKEDQDAWMLTWLLVVTAEKRTSGIYGYFCRLAGKVWRRRLNSVFGDQAQGICARTLGAGHPVGKHFVL